MEIKRTKSGHPYFTIDGFQYIFHNIDDTIGKWIFVHVKNLSKKTSAVMRVNNKTMKGLKITVMPIKYRNRWLKIFNKYVRDGVVYDEDVKKLANEMEKTLEKRDVLEKIHFLYYDVVMESESKEDKLRKTVTNKLKKFFPDFVSRLNQKRKDGIETTGIDISHILTSIYFSNLSIRFAYLEKRGIVVNDYLYPNGDIMVILGSDVAKIPDSKMYDFEKNPIFNEMMNRLSQKFALNSKLSKHSDFLSKLPYEPLDSIFASDRLKEFAMKADAEYNVFSTSQTFMFIIDFFGSDSNVFKEFYSYLRSGLKE